MSFLFSSSRSILGHSFQHLSKSKIGQRAYSRSSAYSHKKTKKSFNRWYLVPFPLISFCLGTWQVYRLQWKRDLIQTRELRMHCEPKGTAPPATQLLENLGETEYSAVRVEGRFLHHSQVLLYPRFLDGEQGVHLLAPFLRTDVTPNEIILINRGFVPEEEASPAVYYPPSAESILPAPEASLVRSTTDNNATSQSDSSTSTAASSSSSISSSHDALVYAKGIVRRPETGPPSNFTPHNEPLQRRWYWIDAVGILSHQLEERQRVCAQRGMEDTLAAVPAYPLVLDAIDDGHGGVPVGSQTSVNLRNNHLSYIITWYGLTAGLIAMLLIS